MSSYISPTDNPDYPSDEELKRRVDQMKANRDKRFAEQGKKLPDSSAAAEDNNKPQTVKQIESVLGNGSSDSPQEQQSVNNAISQNTVIKAETKEDYENPSTFVKEETPDSVSSTHDGKDYSYYQSQIQSTFAQFQGERINEIAKLAKKGKYTIYLFNDDEPEPPKMGQPAKASNETLSPITVYYNEIPNKKHVYFEKLRSEITDLQRVKSMATSSVNEKGIVSPPQLVKNDPNITGLTDDEFVHISTVINDKQTELYKQMALWMFGIDTDTYNRVETTSFLSAIEAGQYREQFGLVESSKNSTSYLR